MAAKTAQRSPPVSDAKKARILGQLGKDKTAEQVAKANKVSVSQVRNWAHKQGISSLRSDKPKKADTTLAKRKTAKHPSSRKRARNGLVVSSPVLRPAISKSCESCSYLLRLLRELVGRLTPRALLHGKR